MRNISFHFINTRKIVFDRTSVKLWIKEIIENESGKAGKISINFCNDEYILEINKEYLQHDYYTDIITFNYNDDNRISGDLLISLDRIRENTTLYNERFKRELYRVIFHGVLHLIGYDDKDAVSEKIMRSKEDFYLSKFSV